MNQADVSKLVSKLRIKVNPQPRKLRNINGPEGRLNKLRKTVTGLIKHERIELNYNRADEARQYTERLISDAIRYGDCHKETMQNADYWLLEKQLVHKLFKVLVPRYEDSNVSYTKLYRAPMASATADGLAPEGASQTKKFCLQVIKKRPRKKFCLQVIKKRPRKPDVADVHEWCSAATAEIF
ncbi:39S ribosomal protein L17, mitochondrial [Eumeta japonica]|uniref:Large ribosomal subunit protein bL17m n=1 Tax=Eumeta variegata TaxID=151549 RepID=A0A4C1V7R3_EUMVA|nr:39S ribosomal protein L17, mitochondrial [Eumeta japonica]